ncbi:MAG: PEP-CTERM sorting domain-containing protein [Candidatus Nealsonbacteria bacterium]|nr:PEP-CTERM sorting domain-containing protein [Candidatus Nealsonbacteria bacterium]
MAIPLMGPAELCAATVRGTVLLRDSFDGPDDTTDLTGQPHDVHLNSDLSARQAGSLLGAVPYRLDVGGGNSPQYRNPYLSSNRLVMKGGSLNHSLNRSQIIAPNHDFVDPAITTARGFVIEFTVNPTSGNTSTDWFAVSLGHTQSSVANAASYHPEVTDPVADFGILFRGNGGFSTFGDGTFNGGGGSYASGHGAADFFDIRVEVETASFAPGETVTLRTFVNNQQLDMGPDPGNELTFLWDGDGSNYISLESRREPSLFDNLAISTIPEPSTFILLTVGAVGLLARSYRQRRKRFRRAMIIRPFLAWRTK